MNAEQVRIDAYQLVKDYTAHGIEFVSEICNRGVNKEVVKAAARLLQSDPVFADWAFIYVMTPDHQHQEVNEMDPKANEPLFTEEDVIFTYTREQAIEDGVLVDVSETAREAGFNWPVALTSNVWALVEDIPPRLQGIADVDGRLWDVLWMARCAALRGGTETLYDLILPHGRKKHAVLKMVSGPHGPHDPRPCITIMLPHED